MTLIELVVVLAIIGILASLLLVGVQSAREAMRRSQCQSHLKQIGLAISQYEGLHDMFPPAWGSWNKGWHIALLPYLEQADLFERVDYSDVNGAAFLGKESITVYLCPSDGTPRFTQGGDAGTNFTGCTGTWVVRDGYNGVFRPLLRAGSAPYGSPLGTGPVRLSDVSDGLSNTIAVSEILRSNGRPERLRMNWFTPRGFRTGNQLEEFSNYCNAIPRNPTQYGWQGDAERGHPWWHGMQISTTYNHASTPNSPSCLNHSGIQGAISSASSAHGVGVNSLFADGHVQFISESIEKSVWREYASRAGAGASLTTSQ